MFYIKYIFEPQRGFGAIGKHNGKDIEGHWKGPIFIFILGNKGHQKRQSITTKVLKRLMFPINEY
jgi:hypothetical protein